ncbi:lytic transglycosylase domain-containing protein [Flavicella sp.]|uniref:lytic transglycosylase domain-containing protein n=1 Tax=Flavicella sp. TaxID=2957742 RepID=UPI00261E325D|nr:lytic transglycosylase domain-containing protein [Flavicella sp.]MDG1803595.1 lytic transglycosylase domain-containing protein [Flavicella sp.]
MRNFNKYIIPITLVCISFALFIYSTEEPIKNTSDTYQIKALKIPNNLTFAGEAIPLNKPDVRERIDKELLVNTYWQSNALLLIKRSHKFFPVIEPILTKNGIPDDFKYLAVIESGLENVTSSAGAKGFWQLMPHTAKERGLEVNNNVDERYNIEKATEAACDYLLQSKEKFGTWTLAAAAYNAGNRGISRNQEKQKVTDYYDLLLSSETQRYVPRIIAIKEILSHPNHYGFIFDNEDLYKLEQTKLVTVDTAIHNIASFAQQMECNYKELKLHNPWLRENHLNNKSRKKYEIKIP